MHDCVIDFSALLRYTYSVTNKPFKEALSLKKSVVSFIAVLLLICFLGVTAVTGVYIPGSWTMPFRNAETT